jgi:DNA-binding CsgD family transcriptional regulator
MFLMNAFYGQHSGMMLGMEEHKLTNLRFQVLGPSLCFIWIFLAFPTVEVDSILQENLQNPDAVILRLFTVGAIPGILIPFAAKYLAMSSVRLIVAATCCILRILGCSISVFASGINNPLGLLIISNSLMGISTTVYLIFWGVLLHYQDTESSERAFMAIFAIVGSTILLANTLFAAFTLVFLYILPVCEFICYLFADKRTRSLMHKTKTARSYEKEDKRFALLIIRTCISIALVSFVWEMFVASSQTLIIPKQSIFGVGLMLAALVIWLFAKYSPSVGFVAAARWVSPIMSLGLLFSSIGHALPLLLACLLLACAQGTFETVLRMQIISFSRKANYDPFRIIGWGFAATMIGAFLGPALYDLLVPNSEQINTTVIIILLAFLVIVNAFLFNVQPKPNPMVDYASYDLKARCVKMGAAYGLSARELEILGYLLEGRSHPYIRDHLYISKSTVDTHVRHIYSKTKVKSKQELIDLSKR